MLVQQAFHLLLRHTAEHGRLERYHILAIFQLAAFSERAEQVARTEQHDRGVLAVGVAVGQAHQALFDQPDRPFFLMRGEDAFLGLELDHHGDGLKILQFLFADSGEEGAVLQVPYFFVDGRHNTRAQELMYSAYIR